MLNRNRPSAKLAAGLLLVTGGSAVSSAACARPSDPGNQGVTIVDARTPGSPLHETAAQKREMRHEWEGAGTIAVATIGVLAYMMRRRKPGGPA